MVGPDFNLVPAITADQAVQIVKSEMHKLDVGKFWMWRGPRGDVKAKVALTLDGRIVSQLELNPSTDDILARGQGVFVTQSTADRDRAVSKVQEVVPNLQPVAARMTPDGEWKVELALGGAVVAEIDVNSRDGAVITDWGASREATLY